jgi:hypothetical protein
MGLISPSPAASESNSGEILRLDLVFGPPAHHPEGDLHDKRYRIGQ